MRRLHAGHKCVDFLKASGEAEEDEDDDEEFESKSEEEDEEGMDEEEEEDKKGDDEWSKRKKKALGLHAQPLVRCDRESPSPGWGITRTKTRPQPCGRRRRAWTSFAAA